MKANMPYDQWIDRVDNACWDLADLSIHDLPDVALMDWYEDGVTPQAAAKRAIRHAKSS